jgi:hypothetical protein
MIKLLWFWLIGKGKNKPKGYVSLIRRMENGRYLLLVDGMVSTATEEQYEKLLNERK